MALTIPRLLLFLIPLLATLAAAADQDSSCYFINKDRAVDDVPCNTTTTGASVCCGKNDICLSNGLCYLQGSNGPGLSRGSCTDQNWSGACATSKPCGMFGYYLFQKGKYWHIGKRAIIHNPGLGLSAPSATNIAAEASRKSTSSLSSAKPIAPFTLNPAK